MRNKYIKVFVSLCLSFCVIFSYSNLIINANDENSSTIIYNSYDMTPTSFSDGSISAYGIYDDYWQVENEQVVEYNYQNIKNDTRFIIAVARGQTEGTKTTTSVTVNGSLQIQGSPATDVKSGITSHFGSSYTHTIEKDTFFSFDPAGTTSDKNTASFYSCIMFDRYKVTLQKYKIKITVSPMGGTMLVPVPLGIYTTEYVLKPKHIVYTIYSKVQ